MWPHTSIVILSIGLISLGFTIYQIDDELKHHGMDGLFSHRKPKKSTHERTTSGELNSTASQ